MKALLVANGDIKDLKLLRYLINDSNFILCADGGLDHLMKIESIPDLVLGDLDSITNTGLEYIKANNILIEKHPVMKDMTDTEIALDYLANKGYKDIIITGGIGSRMDHTMANILLLRSQWEKGIHVKIINENNSIYFVNNKIKLKRRDNYYVSIIPLNDKGIEISLQGFLYPLTNEKLEFSSTKGISNEIIDNYGIINIHKGQAIIIEACD